MHQAVDALFNADEDAEVGDIAYRSLDDAADRIFFFGRFPRVRHDLFEPQRNAPVARVDVEDRHFDLLADLENFRWMGDLAGPRHLRNMDQTFDAALQFDERAVIHQADHFTRNARADGILLGHSMPGIGCQLLHAEGNPFLLGIELEHDDLDFLPHLNNFRRMTDPPPGHVTDVENTVDTAEIDEGAVTGDIFYRALENDAFFENL